MEPTNNKTPKPLPTDPDELAAYIRECAIEIENDMAEVSERAWQSYWRTVAELGLDDEDE